MEFLQVDVFASGPYTGNMLAVFPDAQDLNSRQMQAIASEMNLSETTFVTETQPDAYSVRIFTPREELPFAGHPTLGTAWVLAHLGRVQGDEVVQRSKAGETPVILKGDEMWCERTGTVEADLEDTDPEAERRLARALGLDSDALGLEAREMGRPGRLRPAFADIGAGPQLMVPLKDPETLATCSPEARALTDVASFGAYCFTAVGAGRLRARGFFPGVGVAEDPATGSAAAALGVYLADRLGPVDMEIEQGVEMGRPSRILLKGDGNRGRFGGRCELILTGKLEQLPP